MNQFRTQFLSNVIDIANSLPHISSEKSIFLSKLTIDTDYSLKCQIAQ